MSIQTLLGGEQITGALFCEKHLKPFICYQIVSH